MDQTCRWSCFSLPLTLQFERLVWSIQKDLKKFISLISCREDSIASLQANTVIAAPAVAPAAPKHVTVENVGRAPLVFAITRGELPVALNIQSSNTYFDF